MRDNVHPGQCLLKQILRKMMLAWKTEKGSDHFRRLRGSGVKKKKEENHKISI